MTFKEERDEGELSTTGTEYLQVLKRHVHCLNYKIKTLIMISGAYN